MKSDRSTTILNDLNNLTQNQVVELVGLADALNQKLKEFGVTQYVSILGVEVNRGGKRWHQLGHH